MSNQFLLLKTCCLLFFGLFTSNDIYAQSMSSPYSAYGVGDIDHRTYNLNSGMGYTGIGMKTTVFTSGNNPASSASIEKSYFLLDFSAAGRIVSYYGDAVDNTNSRNQDFTIKKVSIATKLTDFWGSSAGLRQYSSVNYQFSATRQVQGSADAYSIVYSGDGGLNEYYWNNGFAITKRLSVGITGSIVAGPINQTETLIDASGSSIESKRTDYYGSGKLEYGLLYNASLSKAWEATLGVKYQGRTKLNYERTLAVTGEGSALLEEQVLAEGKFSLPQSIGGGISVAHKNGITIAADYSRENWSANARQGSGWRLTNSDRFSSGVEIASIKKTYNGGIRRNSLQFGGFVQNSYLMVNGNQITEWGITGGFTRAMRGGLILGASVESGKRGTTNASLIRENYVQITLHFSYRDFINPKARQFR